MNLLHKKFICTEFELGTARGTATRIFGSRGGSFMWRVNTEKGSYAIKQLAPVIDLTSERMVTKYELSETIAYRFKQLGIPAVCALERSGKHLVLIDNTGYLVYPWLEGNSIGRYEVSDTHSLKIAEVMAKMHKIDMDVPDIAPPRFDIHTNESIVNAIDKAVVFKSPCATILRENENLLLSVNDSYRLIIPLLKEYTVVTHGDLDQLNVLWDKSLQPFLIDWESARKMNPTREIIRTSLDWSGIGTENFSLPNYVLMLQAYINSGGILDLNLVNAALNATFGSGINWMLYNIDLACTSEILEERNTAIEEINWVLMVTNRLKQLIPELLNVPIN